MALEDAKEQEVTQEKLREVKVDVTYMCVLFVRVGM